MLVKSDQPIVTTPTEPLFSVVLPAFNAGKYVSEAVHSILKQTLINFELILINDGSTDDTLTILEEFRRKDTRIILISRENRGLVASLNEGIDLARGKWIARMDADDIALPRRFERQLKQLEESGADICGSWIKLFGASATKIIKHPETDTAIKIEMLFGAPFAHPTVIMKTDKVNQLRYDSSWEKAEDYDLWERAARASWKMTNVQEVLLMYRQHKSQISTVSLSRQQELTQQIRKRYSIYLCKKMQLDVQSIQELLKLREPIIPSIEMDEIDTVCIELIEKCQGEARTVAFDHLTRLYFRAAGGGRRVWYRWSKLNMKFGRDWALKTKFALWSLGVLSLQVENRLFNSLKILYKSRSW